MEALHPKQRNAFASQNAGDDEDDKHSIEMMDEEQNPFAAVFAGNAAGSSSASALALDTSLEALSKVLSAVQQSGALKVRAWPGLRGTTTMDIEQPPNDVHFAAAAAAAIAAPPPAHLIAAPAWGAAANSVEAESDAGGGSAASATGAPLSSSSDPDATAEAASSVAAAAPSSAQQGSLSRPSTPELLIHLRNFARSWNSAASESALQGNAAAPADKNKS
jgi:hypothetical protein